MKSISEEFKVFRSNPENSVRVQPDEHTIRDAFERDRDRIMYAKAFRRLGGKTQVFLADKDDHTRNRLTHTMQVAQIARTIAKTLGLNETLAEAIALGHDMGHAPFGHVGERMLHRIMTGCYVIPGFESAQGKLSESGFKHNWQSVKIVSFLEQENSLNLTRETLWGMLNHSRTEYRSCQYKAADGKCSFRVDNYDPLRQCTKENDTRLDYYKNLKVKSGYNSSPIMLSEFIGNNWTIEAYIVRIADEIAQRQHDIEDAIEYKILGMKELKEKLKNIFGAWKIHTEYYIQPEVQANEEWKTIIVSENIDNWEKVELCRVGEKTKFISALSKYIINLLTTDTIYHTAHKLREIKKQYGLTDDQKFEDIKHLIENPEALFSNLLSPQMQKYDTEIFAFLSNRILNSYEAQKMDGLGQFIIRHLFLAYITNPQQLTDSQLPHIFEKYYKDKSLSELGYFTDAGWDIGKMRNELQSLHSGKHTEEYQTALLRTICDYIAGMTDRHAIQKHRELYNIEYRG